MRVRAVYRHLGFVAAIVAPFGLALLTARVVVAPTHRVSLFTGAVIGLYAVYAIGIVAYFPRERRTDDLAPSGIERQYPSMNCGDRSTGCCC